MMKNILIVNGHPDPRPQRFCAALCEAYARGAHAAGWQTRRLDVCADVFAGAMTPQKPGSAGAIDMECALEGLNWADRLAIVFPLWLDAPPVPLRRFFDRAAGFRLTPARGVSRFARRASAEKLARVVVTTTLPAFVYRPMFRAARVDAVRGEDISLAGVRTVQPTLIGSIGAMSDEQRARWLHDVQQLGARRF